MDIYEFLDDKVELLDATIHQVDPIRIVDIGIEYIETWDYDIMIAMQDAIDNKPNILEVWGNAEYKQEVIALFTGMYWEKAREICLLMNHTFTYNEMKALVQVSNLTNI